MPRAERLDTATVVARAVAIVDGDGVSSLTFRRLAAECGVTPMALYRHVRDKDDLLDRVVDDVLGSFADRPPATGDWRARVTADFTEARRVFLRHPGIAEICMQRPTPVAAVARIYDRVLAALADGDITGVAAVHGFDTLMMFMFGSVLWEIPRTDVERERLVRVALEQPDRTPQLVQQAAELARRDADVYFVEGVQTILDGIEARQNAGREATS